MRIARKFIVLIALVAIGFSFFGSADAMAQPFASLKDSDKDNFYLHAAVAYGLTFTGAEILRHKGVSPWKAMLASSLAVIALGYAKEKLIDHSYSSSDMAGNLVGVGGASITFSLIEF